MSVIISPNMNLPVPVVDREPGPDYAIDMNNSLNIIDQHNHSPGSGVQITPQGLNINSALTLQNNFLTNSGGMTFTAQISQPANNTIYESGTDLYYVDGLGNNVRITQSGAVAGTPGSIGSLTPPATVTYNSASKTFVFQSNTNVAANIDAASYILRNITPNSTFGLTLEPPAALGVDYTITLPNLPLATSLVTMDVSGVLAANVVPDNSTIVIASNILKVPNQGITTTQIANATILGSNIAANTIQQSNLSSSVVGLSLGATQVIFSTPGSTTWTVPAGVTRVIIRAVGGGGGGGEGGRNGVSNGAAGGNGADTIFNSIVVGAGGLGGSLGLAAGGGGFATALNFADFYLGGNGGTTLGAGSTGQYTAGFSGGNGGGPGSGGQGAGGGGGGASSFANGGNGSAGDGSSAPTAGTFGSGGGGSGGFASGGGGSGGSGGKAILTILNGLTPGSVLPITIGAGGTGTFTSIGVIGSAAGGDGYLVINY